MFVEFGDLSIIPETIIAFRWIYKEKMIDNALGLNLPGKSDELAGVVLILNIGQILEIKDAETAEIIREYYERNVKTDGVYAVPATGNIL